MLGLVLFLSVTRAKGIVGHVSPFLLIGFLLFLEYYSLNTTPSVDPVATGLTATITFLVITLAAAAVDLTRSNR